MFKNTFNEEDRRHFILNVKMDLLDGGSNSRWGVELIGVNQVTKGWWWNSKCVGYRAAIVFNGEFIESDLEESPSTAVSGALKKYLEEGFRCLYRLDDAEGKKQS